MDRNVIVETRVFIWCALSFIALWKTVFSDGDHSH